MEGIARNPEPILLLKDYQAVLSVAFSPDGTRIVSGSDDHTIRVWDVQAGEQAVAPLEGHGGGVMSVAFSPDETQIVSGSDDNTIHMLTGEQRALPLEKAD
jgi:WD40 repeat protein